MGILIFVFGLMTILSIIGFIYEIFIGKAKDIIKDFVKGENDYDRF